MGLSINSNTGSSISSLFSSLNAQSTGGTSSIYDSLSEYSSVKNGSYFKLAKQYYRTVASEDTGSTKATNTNSYIDSIKENATEGTSKTDKSDAKKSTSTSSEKTSTLASIRSAADSMTKAADALNKTGSSSPFAKTGSEYDKEKILSSVNDFVKSYNSLIDTASRSSVSAIKNAASSMTNNTAINARSLAKIGITVGEDNKLSIDEETFNKADMNDAKALFSGNGSYGYQTNVSAMMVDSYATQEASKSNTYGADGGYTYNYNSGDLFTQML